MKISGDALSAASSSKTNTSGGNNKVAPSSLISEARIFRNSSAAAPRQASSAGTTTTTTLTPPNKDIDNPMFTALCSTDDTSTTEMTLCDLLLAGLKAELDLLPAVATTNLDKCLLQQQQDHANQPRDGGKGNTPASSSLPSRRGRKENNGVDKGSMNLNKQALTKFPSVKEEGWCTVLPAIDWKQVGLSDDNKDNICNLLMTVATKLWIPIMMQQQQQQVVSSVGCSPHHFQVYHRLATIILGLVSISMAVDNKNSILQHIRALAQRILKEGRMKGHANGATHYYTWFTAVAAECSEALGDKTCAHLCYKSIDKLEMSLSISDSTTLLVYGRSNEADHLATDGLGRKSTLGFTGSGGYQAIHCGTLKVVMPSMVCALIPPSMYDIIGHDCDNDATTHKSNIHSHNSIIGNILVDPGSLMDRVRRTGTTECEDNFSTASKRSSAFGRCSSGSLLVGTFGSSNRI